MVNWESNVFPGILGRTCDRPCEPACRRVRVEEEPVAICRLKRVAADMKENIDTDICPTNCITFTQIGTEDDLGMRLNASANNKDQLIPLLRAAISHRGFALIDVVSPCVTFNNHAGSTKSYEYTRDHAESGVTIDFVPFRTEITAENEAGSTRAVTLHDGSVINLHKADDDYDPGNRDEALATVMRYAAENKVLTGLIYVDPQAPDLHSMMATSSAPLNSLSEDVLCPGSEVLEGINQSLR